MELKKKAGNETVAVVKIAKMYLFAKLQDDMIAFDMSCLPGRVTKKQLEKESADFADLAAQKVTGRVPFKTAEEAKKAFDLMIAEIEQSEKAEKEHAALYDLASELLEGVDPDYAEDLRDQCGVPDDLADRLGL